MPTRTVMPTSTDTTRELLPSGPTRGQLTHRPQKAPPSGRTMLIYALVIALLAALLVGIVWAF